MSADTPARIPPARDPDSSGGDSLRQFVIHAVVPGFIATLLVAIGALGVGWLPLDTSLVDLSVVDALRSTTIGAIVSKGAVVVGIALLLQSWLLVGHDVMHGRVKDIRRLWLALGAWSLPLMLTPPLFSRDVYSYFAQGKLMVAGCDPYKQGSSIIPGWFNVGVDPLWGETPTPYGQFWLLLSRGVARFTGFTVPQGPCNTETLSHAAGGHPYTGALLFRLLAVVGVVLLAWAIPKLAFACGIDPTKALWLGALNPLILMHFVSGAHNDALMVGLIAAGLALAVDNKPIIGTVAVTLAGSTKPIGLMALPFIGLLWAGPLARMSRVWVRWIFVGLIAAAILGVLAKYTADSWHEPLKDGLGWLSALSTPGAVKTWLSPPTAVGMMISGFLSIFGIDQSDAIISVCRLIGTAASFLIIVWLCLKPAGRTPIRGAAIAFFVLVALGPVVQPWYLLWSLPLFAASGLGRIELRIAVIGTAGFTLYGLITSSATQDSLLQIPDIVAVVFVAIALIFALAVSPRERRLMLGDPEDKGLLPDDKPSRARAMMLTFGRPGLKDP